MLHRYRQELQTNRRLFEKGQQKLVVSKNMPPVAGSISWARSIFYRIKRSIIKFLTKEDTLDKDYFQLIKKEYKELAKMIDQFQKEKFQEWNDRIIDKAMGFLKKEILYKVDDNTYHVNFSDEFKILIKEAKQLEKMGYKIPKTIINISLQEREYYQYADRLNLMLEDYNATVNSLNDIDRLLLTDNIKKMNKALEPGYDSLNLSSLGIPDFIDNCNKVNTSRRPSTSSRTPRTRCSSLRR